MPCGWTAIDELLLVGRAAELDWMEPRLRASTAFATTRIARLCWGAGGLDPASLEAHEQALRRRCSPRRRRTR